MVWRESCSVPAPEYQLCLAKPSWISTISALTSTAYGSVAAILLEDHTLIYIQVFTLGDIHISCFPESRLGRGAAKRALPQGCSPPHPAELMMGPPLVGLSGESGTEEGGGRHICRNCRPLAPLYLHPSPKVLTSKSDVNFLASFCAMTASSRHQKGWARLLSFFPAHGMAHEREDP